MKFCIQCGEQIVSHAKFCGSCGYKFLNVSNSNELKEPAQINLKPSQHSQPTQVNIFGVKGEVYEDCLNCEVPHPTVISCEVFNGFENLAGQSPEKNTTTLGDTIGSAPNSPKFTRRSRRKGKRISSHDIQTSFEEEGK